MNDLRQKIADLLFREFEQREPTNEPRGHWHLVAERILAIPEIEAGIGLYLASIEEREDF